MCTTKNSSSISNLYLHNIHSSSHKWDCYLVWSSNQLYLLILLNHTILSLTPPICTRPCSLDFHKVSYYEVTFNNVCVESEYFLLGFAFIFPLMFWREISYFLCSNSGCQDGWVPFLEGVCIKSWHRQKKWHRKRNPFLCQGDLYTHYFKNYYCNHHWPFVVCVTHILGTILHREGSMSPCGAQGTPNLAYCDFICG